MTFEFDDEMMPEERAKLCEEIAADAEQTAEALRKIAAEQHRHTVRLGRMLVRLKIEDRARYKKALDDLEITPDAAKRIEGFFQVNAGPDQALKAAQNWAKERGTFSEIACSSPTVALSLVRKHKRSQKPKVERKPRARPAAPEIDETTAALQQETERLQAETEQLRAEVAEMRSQIAALVEQNQLLVAELRAAKASPPRKDTARSPSDIRNAA